MNPRTAQRVTRAVALLLFAVCVHASLSPLAEAADRNLPGALRVLFIGNSYTKFNNLPRMLGEIAAGISGGPVIETKKALHPGGTLRQQYMLGTALEAIHNGHYTHVVLQAHSLDPFDHPDEMRKYARLFHQEIRRIGAKTVIYETWSRRENHFLYKKKPELGGNPDGMQAALEASFTALGKETGAELSPVGRAFNIVTHRYPEMNLYKNDGTHPSELGTYLAACVFYRVLTGHSPEGSTWRPFPMDVVTAQKLQHVAVEAVEGTSAPAVAAAPEAPKPSVIAAGYGQ